MGLGSPHVSTLTDEPQPLAKNLGWLLSKASQALIAELTVALEKLGISPRSYCILTAALTGDHTQIELARMVGLDKTTLVVALDELEAMGLAERLPSKGDRRVRVIAVTKAGRRKVRQAEDIVADIQSDVLNVLSPADQKVFLDALVQLVMGPLSEPVACSSPIRRRAPQA